MLSNLKFTWRNLKKHRVTSIINISGLAIGMAAAVLIFLWVHNELNYDNYHSGNERIYRIKNYLKVSNGETWVWEMSPLQLADEIRKEIPEVEEVARVYPQYWLPLYVRVNNVNFEERSCAYVDEHWFDVFSYEFTEGNATAFNQGPYSLVITESKAKKLFGKGPAVGKTAQIDSFNYTVRAVVKDNPLNSSFQFDVMMPVAAKLAKPEDAKNETSWSNYNYMTFVRLNPAVRASTVAAKANSIFKRKRNDENLEVSLMPLSGIHFEKNLQFSTLQHGNRNTVYIFSVLGILILLIACINYVNLTTARASLRMKEVSIKKIVGAERLHLVLQFLGESALMSLAALLISLLLIATLMPLFNQLTEKNFSLDFSSPSLWYITAGALAGSVVLTSIYPAIILSSFKPIQIFRGQSFLRVKDSALRKGLVVLQFTFSIALIIGVLVVTKQLNYIQKQDNGYARSQIMSISIPWRVLDKVAGDNRTGFMNNLKQNLLTHSSIEQVALMNQSSIVNMNGFSSGGADWDGRDPEFRPSISYFLVDDDFNKIVDLKMVDGKWFDPGISNDAKNAIINETAARELGLHKPVIGQRFSAQGDTGIIIGVVKDFHFRSMHDKIPPMVIKKKAAWSTTFLIKTAAGQLGPASKAAEKTWAQFLPGQPVSFNYLDDEFDKLYKEDKKASLLITLFATIAIIISCLGLFGLAAFTAERRTKEIGIRKVLGAGVAGIVQLLSREFVLLVIIAFLLASPIAWYAMNAWLQDFAYRVDISWWIFAVAALGSVFIALATVCFQAIKAALRNPVLALRSE